MDAAEQAQRALHGLQFTNMSTDMQRVAAADGAGVGTRWPQELMLACLCVSKPHQINDVSAR